MLNSSMPQQQLGQTNIVHNQSQAGHVQVQGQIQVQAGNAQTMPVQSQQYNQMQGKQYLLLFTYLYFLPNLGIPFLDAKICFMLNSLIYSFTSILCISLLHCNIYIYLPCWACIFSSFIQSADFHLPGHNEKALYTFSETKLSVFLCLYISFISTNK